MNLIYPLYLASQSPSRAALLREAGIAFTVISHTSDEAFPYHGHSLEEYVTQIAEHKMTHVQIPVGVREQDRCLVLVADTLAQLPSSGELLTKPRDRADAERMLRALRGEEALVTTVCIVQERVWQQGVWREMQTQKIVVSSQVVFEVSEFCMQDYFERMPVAMNACGAAIIEGYGNLFLRRIRGSYSAVMGLPLAELYDAFREMQVMRIEG